MASDVNPQRLALVRLLSAVGNISAWGGGRLFTINVVLLAGMAARSSTWSRRICLGNKREWEPVRVSMMEHQPNEVMALLDEAARDPSCEELMLRTPEATDEESRALITKWLRERPGWRLKE